MGVWLRLSRGWSREKAKAVVLRPRSARAFPDRGEAELAGHPDGAGRGVVGRAGQARAGAGLAAPGLASDAPTSFSVKKVRTPPMKCRITAKLTVELGGVPFGRTACRRRCAHLRCTHPSSRPDRGHVGRRRRQRADKRVCPRVAGLGTVENADGAAVRAVSDARLETSLAGAAARGSDRHQG